MEAKGMILMKGKNNKDNEWNFPDESVGVKNKEEAEGGGEEGTADADFVNYGSHLVTPSMQEVDD